jgi:hypothetical protein
VILGIQSAAGCKKIKDHGGRKRALDRIKEKPINSFTSFTSFPSSSYRLEGATGPVERSDRKLIEKEASYQAARIGSALRRGLAADSMKPPPSTRSPS